MKKLFAIVCCAAVLSSCAYSRNVRDYFTDQEQYWSNQAIASCRAAENLREYHQRCLINKKRKLRSSAGELPDNWQQVCDSDHQAFLNGKKKCAVARSRHNQALGGNEG